MARHFPPVSVALFESPEFPAEFYPDNRRSLLQRVFPDPAARFRRIVAVHRRAFHAELGAVWDRATFYWTELARLLGRAGARDACWGAGRRALFPGDPALADDQFRRDFLTEVVFDSHAGFFCGGIEAGLAPLERPRFHLDALSRLFRSLPEFTADDEAAVVHPMAAFAIGHAQRHADETRVEALWALFAECFPRQPSYIEGAAGALHAATVRGLGDGGPGSLPVIASAIERGEALHVSAPTTSAPYQLLGLLYQVQAVQLANASRIPEAVLAARKAEVFGGPSPRLAETQRQLDEIVVALRRSVKRLQEELLRAGPGAQLTAEGRQLVEDARVGPGRADEWAASPDAAAIRTARDDARPGPPFRLPAPGEVTVPLIRLETTTKTRGEESFGDWLLGRGGLRLKAQLAVAAVLVMVTSGVLGREAWGIYGRASAWSRVEASMQAGDDTATLDALADFFSAPAPWRAAEDAEPRAVRLYLETMTRWLSSRATRQVSAEDRLRIERYRRQIVDPERDRSVEVKG